MELVTQDLANKLGTVERRSCARLAVSSLIFVRLGYENGGIAFNISEGGLALSAANGLPDRGIPELTIQLPDSGDWIRTAAQITWRSVSNKECGLQYVGIGEEARQRIREWIAAETSSACSTPEAETNRGFQNVELDTTVPGLGDTVVSVGKEDIGQEDGDASAAAPAAEIGGHGTLQEKWPESESADTDATVFTKEKDEDKIVAERSMLPAPAFCVNPYYAEAVPDRRIHPRIRIIPPGYVELGNENGGIAFSVSEGGISITAADPLPKDSLPSIRLQFPGSTGWVEAKGEIVWRSESKKEAGVRFVDLSEQARLHLRNWLSLPSPPIAEETQTELIRREEKAELSLTVPSAPDLPSLKAIADSISAGKASERASESPPPVAEVSPDFSSLPPAHPGVESRARSYPVKRQPGVMRVRIKSYLRAWTAVAAVLVLAGLAPFIREWFSSRQQATKGMVEVVIPKQPVRSEVTAVAPESPPANVATASQPQRPDTPEELDLKPALPKNNVTEGTPTIPLKSLPHRVQDIQRPSAATAAKKPARSLRESPRPSHGNIESLAAPVATSPTLPREQPRIASSPPMPWPHEEARLGPALVPVVSPPRNAEATGSDKNVTKSAGEGPSLLKRIEPAMRTNGTVAITTDPYPSIRFSSQPNRKKSRGEKSLRLGQVVSRVEPAYPEEAMQQGVQGTVTIHVIVSPEGSIERFVSVDGPPLLVPATVRAVQQWRYSQTLLAGQAVETEDNIAVTFGLSTGINR